MSCWLDADSSHKSTKMEKGKRYKRDMKCDNHICSQMCEQSWLLLWNNPTCLEGLSLFTAKCPHCSQTSHELWRHLQRFHFSLAPDLWSKIPSAAETARLKPSLLTFNLLQNKAPPPPKFTSSSVLENLRLLPQCPKAALWKTMNPCEKDHFFLSS